MQRTQVTFGRENRRTACFSAGLSLILLTREARTVTVGYVGEKELRFP